MIERKRVFCDARGFVVDTSSHKSPGNIDPIKSGYKYHITESGNFKAGEFSVKMTSLEPGTKYYYRACAHNLTGWSYGNEMDFTTVERGIWNKITSCLEFDSFEVGFPSGIKFKLKRKSKEF